MSQATLTHVLLVWTLVLSVVQMVFIIYFFAAGHHVRCRNRSAVVPDHAISYHTMPYQTTTASLLPTAESGLTLGKGHMVTYKATEDNGKVTWQVKKSSNGLISDEGKDLTIKVDGYYLLNLQGRINKNSCSTGLLGKVEPLSAGSVLKFDLPKAAINYTESVTHLDIVYISYR